MILFFAIIVVSLVIFYFMSNSQNTQTLSEDQKLKAEEIALNDSVVQGKIGGIQTQVLFAGRLEIQHDKPDILYNRQYHYG